MRERNSENVIFFREKLPAYDSQYVQVGASFDTEDGKEIFVLSIASTR